MGAVHSVRDLSIHRRVAMKVMLHAGDAAGTARFLEEAQITGQLEHPNIVPVHELGFDAEGCPFYTMKLVRGTTLSAVLGALASGVAGTAAKYPLPVLLTIFQKVCDALAFAHSRQVIHRDLKPENIMLGDFGEVLVMDWGIAKLLGRADGSRAVDADTVRSARSDDASARTLDGSVMGTPYYMPPEQAMGEVNLLDARSDIYSLGAILYEILALHPPVQGARVEEILGKVRKGEIAPMREGGPHLPGGRIPDSLRAVWLKALALSPEMRYQQVTDLQADIRAYENGFATSAENAGAWKALKLLVRRNKTLTLGIAAVFVSLVAGLFSTLTQWARAENEAEKAREQTKETKAANAKNLKDLHEASMADYAVAVALIEKEGKWREGVARLARALELEDGNRLAAARLYSTLSFFVPEKQYWPCAILSHKPGLAGSASAQFSPNGSRIFTVNGDGNVHAWDAATGAPLGGMLRQAGKANTSTFRAQISPDGSRIVTTSGSKVQVWNAATGILLREMLQDPDRSRPMQLSPDGKSIVKIGEEVLRESWVKSAQFSPDGSRILTVTPHNVFYVWDVATGKALLKIGYTHPINIAQFSPDGTRILTASNNKTAQVWDAITGKPLGEPLRHADSVSSAQFSLDGSRIVTSSWDKTVQIWDAASGKALGELIRHRGRVASAQFSPDGTRIVTSSSDNTFLVWAVPTGKTLGEPLRHTGEVTSAQFNSDGARILTISKDKTARVWDAITGKALGKPLLNEGSERRAQFSPDGSRIVTVSGDDRTVRVWETATGQTLGKPLVHEDRVRVAQLSPDALCIVTASGEIAQVWNVASGLKVADLRHTSVVNSARFSPDGSRILTGSADNSAQVWDAATGKALAGPLRTLSALTYAMFAIGPSGEQPPKRKSRVYRTI